MGIRGLSEAYSSGCIYLMSDGEPCGLNEDDPIHNWHHDYQEN